MPTVITRDQNIEAAVNKTYMDMGIKSPQTISSEIGLTYEQERKNFDMVNKLNKELNAETQQEDPIEAESEQDEQQADE
jgi:hypothetical protein